MNAPMERITSSATAATVAATVAATICARRAVAVTLTRSGHALVERLVDRVLGREAELVSTLTEQQQDALTELLRTLRTDLENQLGRPRHSQVGSPY